jgi:hypothetical protein
MIRNLLLTVLCLLLLISCEQVVKIDLNASDPALVVDANITKDSVSQVRLTRTISYFSQENPVFVGDAKIVLNNGTVSEDLVYHGNGYYRGTSIHGEEDKIYRIEVTDNGITYSGTSQMPFKSKITDVYYSKSASTGVLNPEGKTVFTITVAFDDNPVKANYYMILFLSNDSLLERYYLLTETKSNSGTVGINYAGDISFTESIFYDGGEVKVQLYAVDEAVYNYFLQLSDILFWKRRIIPPTPYNPESNLSNGALGYFAAWTLDSKNILLE